MKREEFIEKYQNITREECFALAEKYREGSGKRVPADKLAMLHSLDEQTTVREEYFQTSWGKSHVYVISRGDHSDEGKAPVLVNAHGGGWSMLHTERDIYFCRRMAMKTGCLVFDIDYVLAPEYPYPAAIEEIEAFLNELPSLCQRFGGDEERIVLCGQSAGGNLLGAVTQRGKIKISPLAQILCYPPADNYHDHFHGQELDENSTRTEFYGFFYNLDFEERANHDVSLALSTPDEVRHLPPTHIITGGKDILKPEADRYVEVLKQAGISYTYRAFPESHHGFLINLIDEWEEGEAYVVEILQKTFSR